MTSPLRMILMGHRRTEQSHHPVASELVDRPFVPVNLVHQDLEAPVHDLVDFFRVELLGDGSVICDVGEEDGYELAFAFDGASGREDLLGQVFRCVGLRLGVVDGRGFFRLPQVVATFSTEVVISEGSQSHSWDTAIPVAPALSAELLRVTDSQSGT